MQQLKDELEKQNDYEWILPKKDRMNVPGKFYGSKTIIEGILRDEKVFEQVRNVASLPGIQKYSYAMPDAHRGYGFPIGGVAAFDADEGGVISVGGVGFDISCGVRAMKTDLKYGEVEGKLEELAQRLYNVVPAGLGSKGDIKLDKEGMDEVLEKGAEWAVEKGYGTKRDLEYIEENGRMKEADPSKVSDKAKKRQLKEMGTLGAGNHYLEVQRVDKVFEEKSAKAFGLEKDSVILMLHCGSRALGHQVATDYLKVMPKAAEKHGITIPTKQLASAPINSEAGQDYWKAMNAAINVALANRQVIASLARTAFSQILPEARLETIYEVSHNTCKREKHEVNGERKELYVHRKGATRSFGPGSGILPKEYEDVGQPVIIGGTMGTASYILRGTRKAHEKSFASTCHGAGRTMSRTQAKKEFWGKNVLQDLKQKKNIIIKAHSMSGAAEEAPGAYKNVDEVAESVDRTELSKRVVRVVPLATVKG